MNPWILGMMLHLFLAFRCANNVMLKGTLITIMPFHHIILLYLHLYIFLSIYLFSPREYLNRAHWFQNIIYIIRVAFTINDKTFEDNARIFN